jgi:uncharacterized membrane protein
MWLSTAPMFRAQTEGAAQGNALRFTQAQGFEQVHDIVMGRCSMCHAAEPFWDGLLWAPKGVRLDTEGHIAAAARDIYLQSGISHAMPPANLSYMEEEERAAIVAWYRAATGG